MFFEIGFKKVAKLQNHSVLRKTQGLILHFFKKWLSYLANSMVKKEKTRTISGF